MNLSDISKDEEACIGPLNEKQYEKLRQELHMHTRYPTASASYSPVYICPARRTYGSADAYKKHYTYTTVFNPIKLIY